MKIVKIGFSIPDLEKINRESWYVFLSAYDAACGRGESHVDALRLAKEAVEHYASEQIHALVTDAVVEDFVQFVIAEVMDKEKI